VFGFHFCGGARVRAAVALLSFPEPRRHCRPSSLGARAQQSRFRPEARRPAPKFLRRRRVCVFVSPVPSSSVARRRFLGFHSGAWARASDSSPAGAAGLVPFLLRRARAPRRRVPVSFLIFPASTPPGADFGFDSTCGSGSSFSFLRSSDFSRPCVAGSSTKSGSALGDRFVGSASSLPASVRSSVGSPVCYFGSSVSSSAWSRFLGMDYCRWPV
jgi:hypothetical protein